MSKFFEVNYNPEDGVTLRFNPQSFKFVPEPTRGHIKTANKELLLAMRSFLDKAIARMEEEDAGSARPRKRIRITESEKEA